ncbi:response regulator transcription factor, partial [Myroides ceti]
HEKKYDIILLDWMILHTTGLEVCQSVRSLNSPNRNSPIIFITAKDTLGDTVSGLKAGANDYIKKPFHFEELLARIEVLLRNNSENIPLHLGNIMLNERAHQVFVSDQEISLTPKEFALLALLISNKGKVCTRKQIIEEVWDIHFEYDTSVIDVFINALRKKLYMNKEDLRITTIRGVGYMAQDV